MPRPHGDGTHLGPLERVDEASLADVWVPDNTDGDALRRGLVCFQEAEEHGRDEGREVCALVRGRGLEWTGRRR